MNVHLTLRVKKLLRKYAQRQPSLVAILDRRIQILQEKPQHPNLRLHKLSGFEQPTWSISITSDLRLLFVFVDDGILVVDFGSHDEVY